LKYFEEYVKRNFNEEYIEDFNIPLPGAADNEDAGISGGLFKLTHNETKKLFKPIIKKIMDLIEDQITSIHADDGLVSGVLLVGGLGQSSYLFSQVKAHLNRSNFPPTYSETLEGISAPLHESRENRIIEIMQPANAWTAVVRGAVIRGLEGSIATVRRSRFHYDVQSDSVWQARKHAGLEHYYDELDEVNRVSYHMDWFLAKGTAVTEQNSVHVVRLSMTYTEAEMRNIGDSTDELYAYRTTAAPIIYDETSVVEVCRISSPMRNIPRHLFKKCTNSEGTVFYRLSYDLEMTVHSASLGFAMKVAGQTYGTARVTLNH